MRIPRFRVALLGLAGSHLLKFIEDVAVNRGLPVRCFTAEPEAMRWLAPEPAGARKAKA